MDNERNHSPFSSIDSLESTLYSLECEKAKLKSEEKYVEVNKIAQKIKNLKAEIHKSKLSNLKNSHLSEKELVDKSFSDELSQFEVRFDKVITDFEEKCNKEINASIASHEKKLKKFRGKLESEVMSTFKPSTALLNMIKCKEQAVKQDKYVEAQGLFRQIEELKAYEEQRFAELKRATIDQHLCNFNIQYDKRLQALKKRQKTMLDELNKQKQEEYSILVRKYENLRRELENTQNIRVNIHEGKHTTSAGRHRQSPDKLALSALSPIRQKSLGPKQE